MLNYLKKYRFTFLAVCAVIYLSFYKPTESSMPEIPNLDKLVHLCMYFGISGIFWIELLKAYRKSKITLHIAWFKAFIGPVVMSGLIELLQEYCTTYRGGEWEDFLANLFGAFGASILFSVIYARSFNKHSN